MRPAAITSPAPRCLAICTAIRPALPVAPSTSTDSPGASSARRRSPTQDDIPGFIAAAIATASTPSGSAPARRRSISARSAIVPARPSRGDEVDEPAVGRPPHRVDAGDQRQLALARVVGAARAGADPRVEPGGEHLDDDLVLAARRPGRGSLRSGAGDRRT